MTKQLLFYENVTPIAKDRHAQWSIEQTGDYGFASEIISCPLTVTEFFAASADLAIIFAKTGEVFTPMAVLGIKSGESLVVEEDGSWAGRYVPAFIRRYPFVFAHHGEDKGTFTLCIDETYSGFDSTGTRGKRLFGEDGEPSEHLKTVLEFTKNYEIENRRTQGFTELLDKHGLLDQMNAQVTLPDGTKQQLTGFHVVSRERLKQLEPDVAADFFKRDVLELIYTHLSSMRNLDRLRERLS